MSDLFLSPRLTSWLAQPADERSSAFEFELNIGRYFSRVGCKLLLVGKLFIMEARLPICAGDKSESRRRHIDEFIKKLNERESQPGGNFPEDKLLVFDPGFGCIILRLDGSIAPGEDEADKLLRCIRRLRGLLYFYARGFGEVIFSDTPASFAIIHCVMDAYGFGEQEDKDEGEESILSVCAFSPQLIAAAREQQPEESEPGHDEDGWGLLDYASFDDPHEFDFEDEEEDSDPAPGFIAPEQ